METDKNIIEMTVCFTESLENVWVRGSDKPEEDMEINVGDFDAVTIAYHKDNQEFALKVGGRGWRLRETRKDGVRVTTEQKPEAQSFAFVLPPRAAAALGMAIHSMVQRVIKDEGLQVGVPTIAVLKKETNPANN